MAPSRSASTKSSAGVSLLENMMLWPEIPQASASMSSQELAQSQAQPSSRRMSRMKGLGVAFTAKYSR